MRTSMLTIACIIGMSGCIEEIQSDDFDKSCEVNTDCVLIFEGPICQQFVGWKNNCRCRSAAINEESLDEYESKIKSTKCINITPFESDDECFCAMSFRAICRSGICETEKREPNCDCIQENEWSNEGTVDSWKTCELIDLDWGCRDNPSNFSVVNYAPECLETIEDPDTGCPKPKATEGTECGCCNCSDGGN